MHIRRLLLLLAIPLVVAGAWRADAAGRARAWGTQGYRTAYVALAWPVANVLGGLEGLARSNALDNLLPGGGTATKTPPRKTPRTAGTARSHHMPARPRRHQRTAAPAARGTGLIAWDTWMRHGVAWRWGRLHARGGDGAAIRTGMEAAYGIVALLLLLVFRVPLQLLATRGRRLRTTGETARARWATWRDLRRYRPRRREPKIMLGRLKGKVVALVGERQYLNLLVLAPPGMGKTSGFIIPNILAERGDRWGRRGRSLIIGDLKGELARTTLPAKSRTHRCVVLDFYDPTRSVGYNPFAHVSTPEEVAELLDVLFANTGGISKSDSYFDKSTQLVLQGAILHLKAVAAEEGREPTLAALRTFLRQGPEVVAAAMLESPSDEAYAVAKEFLAVAAPNEKIISGVFTDFPNRLRVMLSESVRAVTSTNELDFRAICSPGARPTCLYLALDPERGQVLNALFFHQLFRTLTREAKAHGGRLPRHVVCYLDEFGNCGTITNLLAMITTGRDARVAFVIIVQALAQLKRLYEEDGKETILAGCATKVALAGTGGADAAWFAKESGKRTATTANSGRSRKFMGVVPHNTTTGYTETTTDLIAADEVRTLPDGELVAISANVRPIRLRQRPWYQRAYTDNWRMIRQMARRYGAPWWWPWGGQRITGTGPVRAEPLLAPPEPLRPGRERAASVEALGEEASMPPPASAEVSAAVTATTAAAPARAAGQAAATFGSFRAVSAPGVTETPPATLPVVAPLPTPVAPAPRPRSTAPAPRPRSGVRPSASTPSPTPARPGEASTGTAAASDPPEEPAWMREPADLDVIVVDPEAGD